MTRLSASGYRGRALDLLERAGAIAGALVRVKESDGTERTGTLVPRYEHADDDYIVLKLKSGYNIGIKLESIDSVEALTESSRGSSAATRTGNDSALTSVALSAAGVHQQSPGADSALAGLSESLHPEEEGVAIVKPARKRLLLVSTGGTIASRVDYRTGAVHPALSAEDLYAAVPELGEVARIFPKVVFSTYSENLGPSDWQTLSESILSNSRDLELGGEGVDGVVIMLGTDTLAYASAALSFSLLGFHLPVVCVGAQRSSDRPSSDAALNLRAAAEFAVNSGAEGVFVAMHESENDEVIAIHSGVRVRKNHTSRRDAFRSIDVPEVARVIGREITWPEPKYDRSQKGSSTQIPAAVSSIALKTNFEPAVALIKFHPGFDPGVIDYYCRDRGVKGIVIEGTGLGHVSSSTVKALARLSGRAEGSPRTTRLTDEERALRGVRPPEEKAHRVFIGITSQCIWGHVDLNVYETGRDLIEAGAVPLGNMLAETALAKLSWALANFEPDQVENVMLTDYAGELTPRLTLSGGDGPATGAAT